MPTYRRSLFLFKIWGPFIMGLGLFGIAPSGRFPGLLLFIVPLSIGFLFHVTLAEVQLRGRKVSYRRFLNWVSIDLDEIESSGTAWVFGFMRLHRFVLPW